MINQKVHPAFVISTILVLCSPSLHAAGPGGDVLPRTSAIQGNGNSSQPAISANGRFVAFASYASNLVPGDTNFQRDVFVRDRYRKVTRRVSVGSGGTQANGASEGPDISSDGRYISFSSEANNLVPGDSNDTYDIFIHDVWKQKTTRVNVSSKGAQANDISIVASMSDDGRFIAFESFAANLVAGDTNKFSDIFVHDRKKRTTKKISGGQGQRQSDFYSSYPIISAGGRFVSYWSGATNLLPGKKVTGFDLYVFDRKGGTTKPVGIGRFDEPGGRTLTSGSISRSGRFVAFASESRELVPSDNGNLSNIFVRDLRSGKVNMVNVGPGGQQANSLSYGVSISDNGRYAVFDSGATNLVGRVIDNGWPNVYVRDLVKKKNVLVSLGPNGELPDQQSFGSTISPTGRYVAFTSYATNLIAGDTNDAEDVYLHDLHTGLTERISVGSTR